MTETRDLVLLPGEQIQNSCNSIQVTHICSNRTSIQGDLIITNYRLFFTSLKETCNNLKLDIPLGVVASTENDENVLSIFCKDFRSVKFGFGSQNILHETLESLKRFAFPLLNKLPFFAFTFSKKYTENGWSVYDTIDEFKRMGLPNEKWRITSANKHYELCESYDKILCVPMAFTDDELKFAAEFRGRNRLPVLSWIHPKSGASICRASHPLVGIEDKRNSYDELLVKRIREANDNSNQYHILDARPFERAEANKAAKGGGYEREECYENCKLEFLSIRNIHVIADCGNHLSALCLSNKDDSEWLSHLESCRWLHHIKNVLKGALKVTNHVLRKSSVLIHCTAGWDRTPQLTSLSMIMMDPYYRKIKGFEVLIEKEWLSMGHKYYSRVVHGEDNHSSPDRSPMFLQWIDCIWQISQQFPDAIEFNEHFLMTILDHLYSCLFGTFLFNNDMLRAKEDVKQKTESLWSYINSDIDQYKNPLYSTSQDQCVILPAASLRKINFWSNYYTRWNSDFKQTAIIM